jgi:hypothetical protein
MLVGEMRRQWYWRQQVELRDMTPRMVFSHEKLCSTNWESGPWCQSLYTRRKLFWSVLVTYKSFPNLSVQPNGNKE